MEQCEEVRNDIVDGISHEHLVAVKLDLVSRYLHIVLDLREIEDTGKVERIVHIQVNMEKRLVRHRIQCTVELIVILLLKVRRLACPKRLYLVYLLLSEEHRHWHELAILVQKALDACLFSKFLLVVSDVQCDHSTALRLVARLHVILRRAVACPFHSLRSILP